MNTQNLRYAIFAAALVGAPIAFAGPITTVPWNGYTGAVSFMYDDARGSQFTNAIPQLDKAGIKATFFIGNMYTFPTRQSDWTTVAKNGHELANHTTDHKAPNTNNVGDMARTLRAMDPSIEAVTLAYPDCNVTGQSAVEAESFMARGCQFNSSSTSPLTYYGWASEPTWMSVNALCVQPANASRAVDFVNGAKSGNSWAPIFTHDVITGPDSYSTTPTDHQKILDQAVSNKVWIAPYATVGAYYRAHFTMDKLTASAGAGPWNLTWTSPHAKMPKSVKLKIKLDAATFGSDITVSQGGTAISKNTDGSYTIEFMKLSMEIKKGSAGVARSTVNLEGLRFHREANGLSISGAPQAKVSVWTLSGTQVGFAEMDAFGSGQIALSGKSSGSLVLKVASPDGSASSSVVVPPVR